MDPDNINDIRQEFKNITLIVKLKMLVIGVLNLYVQDIF